MKKIITIILVLFLVNARAQVIQQIVPAAPFKHVYDTSGLTSHQKEDLQSFEIFKESMYAQKPEATPDTSARYILRYRGNCWYGWVQGSEGDFPLGGKRDVYHCKLDTADEKVYTFHELRAKIPGETLVIYGNRYAWLRSTVDIYYGNVTNYTSYTEYYLERVE